MTDLNVNNLTRSFFQGMLPYSSQPTPPPASLPDFNAGKQFYTVDKNGKQQSITAEGSFRANSEKHEVMNVSDKPLRLYIVEMK